MWYVVVQFYYMYIDITYFVYNLFFVLNQHICQKICHISALLDINCNLYKKLTIHIKDYYDDNFGLSN